MIRSSFWLALAVAMCFTGTTSAQTADAVAKLIGRLVVLDSIDVCQYGVKFRAGLEPSLAAVDADESAMMLLQDPYAAQGKGKPGAVGWYRVSFRVPEKFGKFPCMGILDRPLPCGVESNVRGTWEMYCYSNGKPGGDTGRWADRKGFVLRSNWPAHDWVSNSPMDAPKPGDQI